MKKKSRCSIGLTLVVWLVGVGLSCGNATDPPGIAPPLRKPPQETSTRSIQPPPSHWERMVDDMYENRGVSRIDKAVKKYILTTYCNGVHSVYLKHDPTRDLQKYAGQFVRVRYTYEEELVVDVKCLKAPCDPVTERRAVLQDIEAIAVSEKERRQYEATCTPTQPAPK